MKSLSYLNKYFKKYKWRLLLGVLFITCSNLAAVEMPHYFMRFTDDLPKQFASSTANEIMYIALLAGGVYMLLSLIKGFFLFLTRQTVIVSSRLIEYDLKNEIYEQYQKLDFTFLKKNSTGDLLNRISEDVSHVRMYLGPGIMYTVNLVILFILALYKMLQINSTLTLFVLIPLPIMSYIIFKVSSRINAASKIVQEEQSWMSSMVQESFSGIRVIKAYSRKQNFQNKFQETADNYHKKSMKLVFINSLFMPTIFVLIGLSTLLCIYLGGVMFQQNAITFGEIMAFIIYVNMLTWPFAAVGWVTSLTQRAAASQERINQFLEVVPEIKNNSTEPLIFKGDIEFKNVSFTYKNSGIQAIRNLSFKTSISDQFGIVGRTGSGKSTILHLLMRQVDPDEGEILIDGVNLKDVNLCDFRDAIGVVPQDVFLFSESIKDNLLFGTKENATQNDLEKVCKDAHVHHNIIEFDDKYETLLGERGVNLSGGQKQRISIARALLRKPKLLLLDDCLSAVDTETEDIILENLKKNNNSAFIVSHRISTIRNATKIIVLDDGQIVEKGTHDELILKEGIYSELHSKQLLEDQEENE